MRKLKILTASLVFLWIGAQVRCAYQYAFWLKYSKEVIEEMGNEKTSLPKYVDITASEYVGDEIVEKFLQEANHYKLQGRPQLQNKLNELSKSKGIEIKKLFKFSYPDGKGGFVDFKKAYINYPKNTDPNLQGGRQPIISTDPKGQNALSPYFGSKVLVEFSDEAKAQTIKKPAEYLADKDHLEERLPPEKTSPITSSITNKETTKKLRPPPISIPESELELGFGTIPTEFQDKMLKIPRKLLAMYNAQKQQENIGSTEDTKDTTQKSRFAQMRGMPKKQDFSSPPPMFQERNPNEKVSEKLYHLKGLISEIIQKITLILEKLS